MHPPKGRQFDGFQAFWSGMMIANSRTGTYWRRPGPPSGPVARLL